MASELRKQLEEKTTEELVDLVQAHDLSEWRPEVFRIAEHILKARGVEAARTRPQTQEPVHETLPDPPRFVELLALADPALLMAAKSLFEAAELPFFVKNEATQSLFGGGQLGGYNLVTGPPVLMVEATRLDEARNMLERLQRPAPPQREDEEDPATLQLRTRSTDELIAMLREQNVDEWQPEAFDAARTLLVERGVDVDEVLAQSTDTDSSEQPSQTQSLGRLHSLELVAVLLVCVVPQLIARLDPASSPSLAVPQVAARMAWWLGAAGLTWLLLRHDLQWRAPLPRGSRAWLWELVVGGVLCAVMWVLASRTSAFLAALGLPAGRWIGEDVYRSAFQAPPTRIVYAVGTFCAAIYEETVFRVYLLRRLGQLFGGSKLWAVLVSAALFALGHNYAANRTLVLFLTGVVFGVAYLQSKRLPRLVVAHWLHNLLVMAQYL